MDDHGKRPSPDRIGFMEDGQEYRTKILVVDDDESLRRLVAAYLESEGYEVKEAADGPSALTGVEAEDPQLVVLDLMLPGMSGLEVARRIRIERATPILMLTARGSEEDMLQGFEAGADDYLVKPFSPKVLVARVKAVLRRSGAETQEEVGGPFMQGGLSIDPKAREVRLEGREIELTSTEFELLRVLSEHPGWVYTREELLEAVWGYSYLGDSRLVDVHIANLRKKIGDDPSEPHFVRTVRGVGYKFQAPGPERPAQPKGDL
jgi:two-component system alkaline phosphatase synthesis response regulator PhoP